MDASSIGPQGIAQFHIPPFLLLELNLVDILYQMLRDKDPQVVSNCISVLDEVLAKEGGIVLNSKIAHYLMNRCGYWCIVNREHLS